LPKNNIFAWCECGSAKLANLELLLFGRMTMIVHEGCWLFCLAATFSSTRIHESLPWWGNESGRNGSSVTTTCRLRCSHCLPSRPVKVGQR